MQRGREGRDAERRGQGRLLLFLGNAESKV